MVNPYSGEVAIVVDGQKHVMRLTLGALAALENELGEDSLVSLVQRFESGGQRAGDILALLIAGLRGGGWLGDKGDLLKADIDGGIVEASRAAALLLMRAFALPGDAPDGGI